MLAHRRRIRDIVRICSALYAAWLAFTPELVHASCAGPFPLSTLQARADVIVLGQVTQTTGQDARVVVHMYHKGRGPHELNVTGRVSSDPGTYTSVDFIFKPGQWYLLFLTGSPPGLLRTNECAGNREGVTVLTPEELAVLGQGVPPNLAAPDPVPLPANGVGRNTPASAGPTASDQQTTLGTPGTTLPLSSAEPRREYSVNDDRSSFTGRAAAFLLPLGMLLVGFLLLIVTRRWRRVH